MSPFVLFLSLLIALIRFSPSLAQSSFLYSFCFSLSSTLSVGTSPSLPWSIYSSGTLQLIYVSNSLYQVVNATGQRVTTSLNAKTVQSLVNVAPPSSFEGNDNLIALYSPFLSASHSVSFLLDSAPQGVYFTLPSSPPFVRWANGTGQMSESEAPEEDESVNSIVSSFTLTPSATFNATVKCPTSPLLLAPKSAVTAFNTPQNFSFCYSFTGGPNDGTTEGNVWTISASGQVVTSGYPATILNSASGMSQQAYILTNISGTRTFTLTGTQSVQITNNFVAVLPSAGALYTSYPYFDLTGVTVLLDSPAFNIFGNTTSNLIQLNMDYASDLQEINVNAQGVVLYPAQVSGIMVLERNVDPSTLQCSFTAGPLLSYQFCYQLQPSDTDLVTVYGIFTATGPEYRKGKQALTMQSMTGVRIVTNDTGSVSSNIVKLVYIDGDNTTSTSTIYNDNLLFTSGWAVDYYGFVYSLSSPAIFPNYTTNDYDINLSIGSGVYYEWPVSADLLVNGISTTAGSFSYNGMASSSYFPCDTNSISTPISTFVMYFCFHSSTSSYQIATSGQITLYSTNITMNNRVGYAIGNITGTRTLVTSSSTYTIAITGVSADSFGAINNTVSQLVYMNLPAIDSQGILFVTSANPMTPQGNVVGASVLRLSSNTNGQVFESGMTINGVVSSPGTFSLFTTDNMSCTTGPMNDANSLSTRIVALSSLFLFMFMLVV